MILPLLIAAGMLLCPAAGLAASDPARPLVPHTYLLPGDVKVVVPGGPLSFAARIAAVSKGKTPSPSDPISALGEPDAKTEGDGGAYSVGCGGELTLEFTGMGITEQEGPELYFFEVGEAKESADLFLSNNLTEWLYAATTRGGPEPLDLSRTMPKSSSYIYLKIRDLGDRCLGTMPGVDVDAVAAFPKIEARRETGPESEKAADARAALPGPKAGEPALKEPVKLVLDFAPGKASLTPEHREILQQALESLPEKGLFSASVSGFADKTGSQKKNRALSLDRARAAADFLKSSGRFQPNALKFSAPEVKNGRAKGGNGAERRVEVVIFEAKP